jgi:hypothetical protein
MKKLSKIGMISITLLIATALIVSGALMSYYLQVTVNVDSGVILEYSEDDVTYENAEDLDKTFDYLNFVGDDIDTKLFYMKCNANLDNDLPVTFTISNSLIDDDPDGMTIALQYDNGGTWTDIFNWTVIDDGSTTGDFTFSPADEIDFRMWVEGDYYLKEGDHAFTLDLEYDTTP